MINSKQQQALYNVVMILSSRNVSDKEQAYCEAVKSKAPKMYQVAKKLAAKVRVNVDNYMADTWIKDIGKEVE